MSSYLLFGFATFSYLLASLLYIALLVFDFRQISRIASFVTIAAFIAQTGGIIIRWIETYKLGYGHAPLSNMYESLIFFSWSIAICYLWLEKKQKLQNIGPFVVPLAFAGIAYASFAPEVDPGIKPLIPALQSNWLLVHVIACFIGYAAFSVAFGLGIMYLINNRQYERGNTQTVDDGSQAIQLPNLKLIGDLINKSIVFGYIWLSAGIITGAIWANSAWGTYWSWDPKETWSLITWFIYATAIHVRFARGWSGRRIAWLSVAGFLCIIFTYYGVNYLLPSIHGYNKL